MKQVWTFSLRTSWKSKACWIALEWPIFLSIWCVTHSTAAWNSWNSLLKPFSAKILHLSVILAWENSSISWVLYPIQIIIVYLKNYLIYLRIKYLKHKTSKLLRDMSASFTDFVIPKVICWNAKSFWNKTKSTITPWVNKIKSLSFNPFLHSKVKMSKKFCRCKKNFSEKVMTLMWQLVNWPVKLDAIIRKVKISIGTNW